MRKLDKLLFESVVHRGMAGGDVEFRINGTQVRIDGAWTDDQGFGNLGVGEPTGHQAQHLHLSPAESVWIGWRSFHMPPGLGARLSSEQWLSSLYCEEGPPNGGLCRHRPSLRQCFGKDPRPKLSARRGQRAVLAHTFRQLEPGRCWLPP